jgi:hypothetical protein
MLNLQFAMGLLSLEDLLTKHKTAILEKWYHLILETYPSDTAGQLKKEKDPFINPVGSTFSRESEAIFNGLFEGKGAEQLCGPLDRIVRIRSVQDFSPSQAVGFIFLLKKAVKETFDAQAKDPGTLADWLALNEKIDELALQAFDLYMACREKIFDIKVKEIKTQKEMMQKMLNRINLAAPEEKEKKEKGANS